MARWRRGRRSSCSASSASARAVGASGAGCRCRATRSRPGNWIFYQETKLKNLKIKQSIGSPVKDLCCPKYHEDILPNPRRLLRVTFYQVQDKECGGKLFNDLCCTRVYPKQESYTEEQDKRSRTGFASLKRKPKGSP